MFMVLVLELHVRILWLGYFTLTSNLMLCGFCWEILTSTDLLRIETVKEPIWMI
jgi:hypothetical protein